MRLLLGYAAYFAGIAMIIGAIFIPYDGPWVAVMILGALVSCTPLALALRTMWRESA
jgi:hypothetical protein